MAESPARGEGLTANRIHAHSTCEMRPDTNLFQALGGEPMVARLVDRFYDHMETAPAATELLALHDDLPRARERLRLFMVGWLGGPPLYIERFGHPRLRARHLPFAIGPRERDQWMLCMREALNEVVEDGELRATLDRALAALAAHMLNRPA